MLLPLSESLIVTCLVLLTVLLLVAEEALEALVLFEVLEVAEILDVLIGDLRFCIIRSVVEIIFNFVIDNAAVDNRLFLSGEVK